MAYNLLHAGSASGADIARRVSPGVVEHADTERDHALLLVLGSASDDTLSLLRVDEALSAVLLHATDLRLATCPLSQPLEVDTVRTALQDELLGGTMIPQWILRLGWAARGAELPPTPRRPLADQTASCRSEMLTRPSYRLWLRRFLTVTTAEAAGFVVPAVVGPRSSTHRSRRLPWP